MINICCMLRGEHRVVSIKIATAELVATLKELVNEKLQLQCPTDKLQYYKVENLVQSANDCSLHFALDGCEHSEDTLMYQVLADQRKLMAPAHPVSTYLLNASTAPGSIHVLVEQPCVDGGEENLDGSAFEQCKQLTRELQLVVRIKKIRERIVPAGQIPAFEWRSDGEQNEKWLTYLQEHLGKLVGARGFCLEAVSDVSELLNIADDRLPFDLRGGADAVIVKNQGASLAKIFIT